MIMTFSGNQLARRSEAGTIEIRPEALRVRWRLGELATGDIHLIDVDFSCSVRALDQRGEREMFAETFLSGRDIGTADDVAGHFAPTLRAAACALAVTRPAQQWIDDGTKPAI